ncbi:hypothetical protein D187_002627 [Cystobacter fuscus DSM 2262]|uniref:Lipoprotein n=1 Tax=Cystobacter fuscus (strain ATCC 25194 / DSM 2262 / NBRC 100088 / M29) TaxID=1242864 RepID=S9QTA5_CYSF2|nr:hypothetical protein [Cystobacter fuscus]EPX59883.1 hypothetical protein D187_002627 [Cystobacter fuscus DSM 2262]
MTKQLKGLWAVAALVVGVGTGFTAGAWAETPAPSSAGLVECARDSQCDAGCGAVGAGACHSGRCYCRF